MKRHNQRPGSRPRHGPPPAIWAAAAVILLAVAACGSATTPTGTTPTTASYGASGHRATLRQITGPSGQHFLG
jgi:hypothetical protein